MKLWLTYSPILILIIFTYLLAKWIKHLKTYRQETGIKNASLLTTFLGFHLPSVEEKDTLAYKKLRRAAINNFKIWGISLLVYMIISIIIGVTTAEK